MRRLVPFLLVLFLIAIALQVDLFFAILYFGLAVYLLSRMWSGRMTTPLEAQRTFVKRAFHGETVKVDLDIRNSSWLPIPWLEVHESLPAELITPPFERQVVSLGPREARQMSCTLFGRRRGYYAIGPLRLRSGGVFGIHPSRTLEVKPEHLIVYPQIVPLQQLGLPTRSPLVALPARTPLFEDPNCVVGVRDYQRGDSPRRIHWTATASTGRLLVKQYRPSISRETMLFIDLSRDGYSRQARFSAPELAIKTAASLVNHIAVQDKLAVGLATEATDPMIEEKVRFYLPPRSGRGQLMSLLDVLARVELCEALPLAELLRQESTRLHWGATLVVITGRESEPLYDSLVFLRRAGFAVALVLIQPGLPSAALRQRAELLSIPIHRVWRQSELSKGFGHHQGEMWL